MINDRIEYLSKRKKLYESLRRKIDHSFKTLSQKQPLRIRKKLLPQTKLYPSTWTYLVSNEKHPHTITLNEFRRKKLKEGDKVYFERGQIYNFTEYTILVDNITFGSYGTGADPVFLGSTDIGTQSWNSEGSNQFSTSWASPVKWLFVNGVAARLAETPWYKITSQADETHLTATTLNGAWGTSVAGSQVLVRERYFTYSFLNNVTAYSAGQITLDVGVRTGLTEFTFKLYNMRQFMSDEFDFFHDSGANTLYYQTSGSSPAGTDIRVCTEDSAIVIDDNVQNFICDGIEFSEYFNSAIKGFNCDGFQMRNCNVNNIRTNGIFIYGPTSGVVVEDNTFSKCGQNGMLFGGLISPTVQNNTMTTFGRERTLPFAQKIGPTLSDWEQTTACAIVFTYDLFNTTDFGVSGGLVTLNTISDCGYCGINFTGSLTEVSYNRIDEVMLDVEDGGGIYCIAQPELPEYGTVTSGTLITKNIITNVRGKYENCPLAHPTMNSWGIYVDKSCDNISVLNNTLYLPDAGGLMKFNFDCHNNIITDNIMVGGVYGVQFNSANTPYTANDGNVMTGNVIATAWYSITSSHISDGVEINPFLDGGNVDNNFYLNNYGDVVFRKLNGTPGSRTLASWQSFCGDDAASVGFPITRYNYSGNFATVQEIIIELNETDSSVLFEIPAGFVDKSGTVAGNDVSIPAHEGVIFVRTSSIATVYDTFAGTNGTSISGRTPDVIGGNWTLNNGAITISSNAMVSASSGNATVNTADTDANVFVASNKGTTGNINILLRHNGSSGTTVEDYIWIFWGSDAISLIQHTGGSPGTDVTLASAPHELPASTACYLEAQIIGNRVLVKAGLANAANEVKIDYTGVTMNPSSTRHGFRQTITGSSSTTTFAISSP